MSVVLFCFIFLYVQELLEIRLDKLTVQLERTQIKVCLCHNYIVCIVYNKVCRAALT